ncbi:MAG: hypothetical protein PHV30_11070 [Candidatus Margulisbacteria bacterium]|nr:hypothetical protein [Candidatus Margulisiibacteriota bacterium]
MNKILAINQLRTKPTFSKEQGKLFSLLRDIYDGKVLLPEIKDNLNELMANVHMLQGGKGLREVFAILPELQFLATDKKPSGGNIAANKIGLWQCLQNFSSNTEVTFGKIVKYLQELGIMARSESSQIFKTTEVQNTILLGESGKHYGIEIEREELIWRGGNSYELELKIKGHEKVFTILARPDILVLHRFITKIDKPEVRANLEMDKERYQKLLIPDRLIMELLKDAERNNYQKITISLHTRYYNGNENILVDLSEPNDIVTANSDSFTIMNNWRKNYAKGYKVPTDRKTFSYLFKSIWKDPITLLLSPILLFAAGVERLFGEDKDDGLPF